MAFTQVASGVVALWAVSGEYVVTSTIREVTGETL